MKVQSYCLELLQLILVNYPHSAIGLGVLGFGSNKYEGQEVHFHVRMVRTLLGSHMFLLIWSFADGGCGFGRYCLGSLSE